jgi:hypothetical protein
MYSAILVGIAGLAVFVGWRILIPIAQLLELSEDLSGARTDSRPENRRTVAERETNYGQLALGRMPVHPLSFRS